MAELYGDFDDSDDLEGNDEEFGALGSILSWDDEEDHAARTSDTDLPTALTGKAGGTPLPPGLVSFSLAKDANGQLYLPQVGANGATNVNTDQATGLPLPNPTPINFAQEHSQAAQAQAQAQQIQQQQQQQQAQQIQQQQQQAQQIQQQQAQAQAQAQHQQVVQQQQPQAPQQAQQPQQIQTQAQAPAAQQQPQAVVAAPHTVANPQIIAAAPGVQQGLAQANFAIFQQNGQTILQQTNAKQPQQPQQLSIRPAPTTIAGMVVQQVGQPQQVQQVQQAQQLQPQQQQVQQLQPQVQQVQQVQQPQTLQVQQVQQVQQQQVQQVQAQQVQQLQQAAAQQFSITGDANAFLRQLQVAQIQQQFNALQQQGGLAQSSLGTAQQQAVLQQQLQQLQRGQLVAVANPQAQQAPPPPQPQAAPPAAAVPRAAAKPPPKAPTTKARATATRKKAPSAAVGVVSASDTDGELSSRGLKSAVAKKTAAELTATNKKRKPPEPIDTSNMTPAEKAKANRDRNREHARNTRLRKKAYLEKLKATVDELCKERDTLVSERAGAANLLVEMHNTRTEVLMSFFALRSTNEKRRKLWASILDESCFACVMPVTPYRSFPASEVQVSKCQRTVLGIDGMMADTASLHVLLSSLVDRSKYPHGKIEFCYTLVTEEAVVAGNQMMARWVMSTLNATQFGARMEVAKQGMLCCKFNSAHRITGLELMFDVMALMLQLKQAAGSESFSVIPNTVQTCQRSFDKPMVMTLAEGPYTIVQVNQLWENMTGYKAEEVVGKTSCNVLQGPLTDKVALQDLMTEVRFKRAASVMLVNYTKSGEKFRNFIVVFPLSTDSRITHYLALTSFVERISENPVAVAAPAAAAAAIVQQPSAVASTPANGFNANTAASAGQMHQMLQTQAQSIQGNAAATTAQQQQAALANAASAALLAQSNMLAANQAAVVQGQMLPPPAAAAATAPATTTLVQQPPPQQQQAQPFTVQNVTPQPGDVVGTSQLAQV